MKIKRRTMIRLILFLTAAISILLAKNAMLSEANRQSSIVIKNSYIRALEDLSSAADNISITIEKQLCSGTSKQQELLANKLFNEASNAKQAMSRLPMKGLSLENTYKYLSQVGNYAVSIAEKTADQSLSEKDYNDLKQLRSYAEQLSDRLWELERAVSSGEIDVYAISDNYTKKSSPDITEGFTEFEEGFSSYPTLIYDGPFSDHIMEKEPIMTKGEENISSEKALERASMVLEMSSNDLSVRSASQGKLPCWIFSDRENTVTCAVTKKGGFVSYFIKSEQPKIANISVNEAVESASEFLKNNGYGNMKVTYYEKIQNTVTVNFAYYIDKITCYTDLMKVTVSLENGDILGWDATGYIVNHQTRSFPERVMSVRECKKRLSPYLECRSSGMALIPTEGGNEQYCYEYKCRSEDGRDILVYINAQTGREEQILILIENDESTLTM